MSEVFVLLVEMAIIIAQNHIFLSGFFYLAAHSVCVCTFSYLNNRRSWNIKKYLCILYFCLPLNNSGPTADTRGTMGMYF